MDLKGLEDPSAPMQSKNAGVSVFPLASTTSGHPRIRPIQGRIVSVGDGRVYRIRVGLFMSQMRGLRSVRPVSK